MTINDLDLNARCLKIESLAGRFAELQREGKKEELEDALSEIARQARGGDLTYLASPYSHPDPWVRQERYNQALNALTKLLSADKFVFSPIVHSHHADGRLRGEKDHSFWMRQAIEMLKRSDRLTVLMLDGWKQSKGVAQEVVFASRQGIPVDYMEWA